MKYSLYFDNKNPEIINYNSGIYCGTLKDNKPDGMGVLVKECDIIYKGEFKEGTINGKGKSFIYDKNDKSRKLLKIFEGTFIGETKNGKYIEYDRYNCKKKIFEGEYKEGKREGKGIEYKYNNKLYKGCFKNGQKNGNGILYASGGIKRYEGNFENNFFHGNGKLFYDNRKIQYDGKFNKGFLSEEGVYYDYANYGQKTKVFNGLPLINNEFPKVFNIYYNEGQIHYTISLNNYQLKGREYNKNGTKIYSGDLKRINMNEKKKKK